MVLTLGTNHEMEMVLLLVSVQWTCLDRTAQDEVALWGSMTKLWGMRKVGMVTQLGMRKLGMLTKLELMGRLGMLTKLMMSLKKSIIKQE